MLTISIFTIGLTAVGRSKLSVSPRLVIELDCSANPIDGAHTSLVSARDALRREPTPRSAATILVRGRCSIPPGGFTLEAADANVLWSGVVGTGASITGGVSIPTAALKAVTDPHILAQLPAAARSRVRAVDLVNVTAEELGTLQPHAYPGGNAQIDFFKFTPTAAELFWDAAPLQRARYPNSPDQLMIPQNSLRVMEHKLTSGSGNETIIIGCPSSADAWCSASTLAARLRAWGTELAQGRDLWAHGEWTSTGWADTHKRIVAVDAAAGSITTTASPLSGNEGKSRGGGWLRVYNSLHELDAPGEYLLVASSSSSSSSSAPQLLVYPPMDVGTIVLSIGTSDAILRVSNTSNVRFTGIDIENGRAWGAVFNDCTRCGIANANVRNFGINAVNVTGGINFSLHRVNISGTGQGGAILTGGDRQTLTRGNHSATKCVFHDFARILNKYTPAICLCGVGHTLAESVVRDGPHFGMLLTGNDHLIRGNHFHTLVQAGADAGAIYSGRDWTYRGQVIEGNVFENISSFLCHPGGNENCHGQPPRALHSDDGMSGWTIRNNTFVNCTKVWNAYASRDMIFVDNMIAHINVKETSDKQHDAIHLDVMKASCAKPHISSQYKFLHRVPYNKAPYTKYPHLANILSDSPCEPKYWNLSSNVYCDITADAFGDAPLIGGDFDPKTFGVFEGNVNSSACARGAWRSWQRGRPTSY